MREILFRGKSPDSSDWLYGDYVFISGEHGIKIRGKVPYFPVIPETIGQFIGRTDKNRTKIFDGDKIIYTEHPGYRMKSFQGVIIYDPEYAAFAVVGVPDMLLPMYFSEIDCIEDDFLNHCEVIGNIHDNPELIKT